MFNFTDKEKIEILLKEKKWLDLFISLCGVIDSYWTTKHSLFPDMYSSEVTFGKRWKMEIEGCHMPTVKIKQRKDLFSWETIIRLSYDNIKIRSAPLVYEVDFESLLFLPGIIQEIKRVLESLVPATEAKKDAIKDFQDIVKASSELIEN